MMGSGKSGGGENWAQVAGEQGYTQWSPGGTPGMTEDAKNYEGYMTGWNMRQGEYDTQQANENMMSSFMSAMAPQQYQPSQPSQSETAQSSWDTEGIRNSSSSFGDLQKYLGTAGEGQSYLYGPSSAEEGYAATSGRPSGTIIWSTAGGENVADEDVGQVAGQWANKYTGELVSQTGFDRDDGGSGGGGANNWYIGDTPSFNGDDGYTGEGFTSSGQSFTDGRGLRDIAMKDYTKALGDAESFVNSQVSQERTNARLMGISYDDSPAARNARISNALGDHGWGESQQTDFQELLDTWGSAGYEQAFTPTAGGGSSGQTAPAFENTPAHGRPSTAITEEDTLGQTSLLGG